LRITGASATQIAISGYPLLADPLLGVAREPRQPATEPFQFRDGFLAAATEELFRYGPVDEAVTLPLPKPRRRRPDLVLQDHVDTM
jgi:hypothetical protein